MSTSSRESGTGRLPSRIVSGGQTGVDRAALEVAIHLEIPHGGWCPLGRLAEDGPLPDRFELRETSTADYAERTRRNVQDSDGTLVLHCGPISGGTALTVSTARSLRKPLCLLDLGNMPDDAAASFRDWLRDHRVSVLNVAGPRESTSPGIGRMAERALLMLLADGN